MDKKWSKKVVEANRENEIKSNQKIIEINKRDGNNKKSNQQLIDIRNDKRKSTNKTKSDVGYQDNYELEDEY